MVAQVKQAHRKYLWGPEQVWQSVYDVEHKNRYFEKFLMVLSSYRAI